MQKTVDFLNDQIEADEVWKRDHIRAAECAALQDVIKAGLSYFNLIRSTDELWSRRVQAGSMEFEPEVALALHQAYEWWVGPCDQVFDAVAVFEKEGYAVDGAAELRKAHAEVRCVLKTDVSEVIEGMKRARAAA